MVLTTMVSCITVQEGTDKSLKGELAFSLIEEVFEYNELPENWSETKSKLNQMDLVKCENLFEGSIFYRSCLLKSPETQEEITLEITYILNGYVIMILPHKNSTAEMITLNLSQKVDDPLKHSTFLASK